MEAIAEKKLTYSDYLKTPEGSSWQLIEGALVEEAAAPGIAHQRYSGNLYSALREYVEKHDAGLLLFAPVDVYLNEYNCLQPDLVFVAKERMEIIDEAKINGAPGLVVEVISRSTASRDIVQKRALYEQFGVGEYWLVYPNEKRIETLQLANGKYELAGNYPVGSVLRCGILKTFALNIDDIFTAL